jgi:hypothetical protein
MQQIGRSPRRATSGLLVPRLPHGLTLNLNPGGLVYVAVLAAMLLASLRIGG